METLLLEQASEEVTDYSQQLLDIYGRLDMLCSLTSLVVDCLIIIVVLLFVYMLAQVLERFLFSHI